MAVSPVNVTRISNNLRTSMTLESLRRNQIDVFLEQTRLAAGRAFVTPSEDPVGASRALDLTEALSRQEQFRTNVQYGDTFLTAADSSLTELNSLLIQASSIASMTVSNLTSEAERDAEAEVVAAIRQQVQIVANRQFNGRYLFGGRSTLDMPFVDGDGGVVYTGDIGELLVRPDDQLISPISLPGSVVFGGLSAPIAGNADLTPTLLDTTRLADITGAAGRPIEAGTLIFNEIGGAGVFTVDLRQANTIGDVVNAINQAATDAGAGVTATLGATGLVISPGSRELTITDTGGAAADLGILTTTPTTADVTGGTLTARVTRLTPVTDLAQGAGIDLDSGIIISNGSQSVTLDLSGAETVQDIINAINNAGVFVHARVSADGTGIDVYNRVSGSALSIAENDGTTATDLGIRTFDTATPIADLNFGDGVTNEDGAADLRIVAKDGSTVDVDLDGAATVGDVIDRINDAATTAAVDVEASFTTTGNGIQIEDNSGGGGALQATVLNTDANVDLGLSNRVAAGTNTTLVGDDVNPVGTGGIIDALFALERALRADDSAAISSAGNRLDEVRDELTRMHGIIGARSQTMALKKTQMEDAAAASEIFLSDVRDLNYAETITKMQMAMTRLQANLQSSSATLNLSILDFLR